MGRMLQIRVSAETFRPEDVEDAYPNLCALAWPEPRVEGVTRGVLELPEALFSQISVGDWSEDVKEALRPGTSKAEELKRTLESALADRNPQEADKLSYELEDALAALEKKAAELA